MANILDIYARASRRLPLTPAERALLKTLDQLLLSALAGAGVAILQAALAGQQPLTFAGLAQIGAYAAATALLTGVTKLFRARGDALGAAIAQGLDQAAARMPGPPRGYPPTGGNGYSGPPSRPLTPQRRAELLAQSGGAWARVTTPQATPPISRAAPADVAATQPIAAQTPDEPPTAPIATPAPSQTVAAPVALTSGSAEDENGPPTLQMAAVKASAPAPATAATDVPAQPAPASQWLTQ